MDLDMSCSQVLNTLSTKKKKKLQKVQKENVGILKMSYMSSVVHGVLLI